MSEVLQISSSCADSLADDFLTGAEEIGAFTGNTTRRAYYLLDRNLLPAFREGGIWRMRKSTYLALIERREAAAFERCVSAK